MSAEWRVLRNASNDAVILPKVRLAIGFWAHFRGLQLVGHLPEDEGLLFMSDYEGRTHTTIHMFFMRFPIGVVWLDAAGRVVDKTFAKPWRPAYAPQAPAQYFLEANPSILERVEIGDTLLFDEVVSVSS